MRVRAFDHVALWVDERDLLSRFLCEVTGMHEIERTSAFTLVGGDARRGKLTLFDAEGPRDRGVLERIVLRVADLDACLGRMSAGAVMASANGVLALEAPANVPLGLVEVEDCDVVDLDHVVLCVPDTETAAASFGVLGFEQGDDILKVEDKSIILREGDPEPTERPLLNHLALLVESLDDTLAEAARHALDVDRVVDAPNTLAAFVNGPDGVVVEYVEHKPGFALV